MKFFEKAKTIASKAMVKIKQLIGKLTTNHSVKSLLLKSICMLLAPYVYLFVCGFIFDMLLKWYFMTTFIFVTLCLFALLAVTLIVVSVVKFVKK